MVLDTVEKVTKDDQNNDCKSGDYKLIFKNTHADEENDKPKKYTINANSPNSPDVFYFVHIDVDLNQIKDCTCQNRWCKMICTV